MRKLDFKVVVVVGLVLAVGGYFLLKKDSSSGSEGAGPMDTYGRPANQNESVKGSNAQTLTAVSADDTQVSMTAESQTENIQKFQNWLRTESKNLEQPHVDTRQKDLELKKIVENFSEAEKKIVIETAQDTKRAANERILAAYLLVLDQSKESLGHLGTLAQKALPDFGPVTAHSEAEIRRGQELAVRYMAIDELGKRAASNNPEAFETLKNLVNSGESAEIRGYAQRVMKEIK